MVEKLKGYGQLFWSHKQLKIYTASKLKHADKWRELAHDWPDFEFVARWPHSHVANIPDTGTFAKLFWQEDEEDVREADVLLLFAGEGDVLRGALVEAGMALVLGKPVIIVGEENAGFGTWQYHPKVYRVADFDEAYILLTAFARAL